MATRQALSGKTGGDATFDGITLTNPDKVYYPDIGLTKLDVARYYETRRALHAALRRATADQPGALPRGNRQGAFLPAPRHEGHEQGDQGSPDPGRREQEEISLYRRRGGAVRAGADRHARDPRLGRVADHRSASPTASCSISIPTRISTLAMLKAAAVEVRDFLAELGFKSFLKATGGKGLHVVAPLTPKLGWDEVKAFAKAVADALVAARPDRYTANMAEEGPREGKIFVDYLRNQRGGTAIVQLLDPRARRRAGRLPAPLGRAERPESGRALHGQDPAGAAEGAEARSVGGIFFHPPVDHGKGAQSARPRLDWLYCQVSRGGCSEMSVRSVGVRPPAFTLPALATLLVAFGSPLQAQAQAVPADAVATPLVATPLTSPNPVLGSDDKTHLAYELVLMSMAASRSASTRSRRSMPRAARCSARLKATASRRCCG